MPIARPRWYRFHRLIGMTLGLWLLVVCATGVLITFRGAFREPPVRAPEVDHPLTLGEMVALVETREGEEVSDISRPSRPSRPYQVWLDDDAGTILLLDGAGNELARRKDEAHPVIKLAFAVHTAAVLGPLEQPLSALTGLAGVLLSITGATLAFTRKGRRPSKPAPGQAS